MHDYNAYRQKSARRRGTDNRENYFELGVDADGRRHVYRTLDETVFVVADRERVHRQDVTDRSVDEWVAFVDREVGWRHQKYGHGIAGLVERVADAVEGGAQA